MARNIFISMAASLIWLSVIAQSTELPSKKIKFHSINQVGLLQGQTKSAVHLQSVNGFQYHNVFAGVGIALDYNKYKSIPLFLAVRKYFGKTSSQFFLLADAGINFIWEKNTSAYYYKDRYYSGFYGNAGIGYKAGFKNGMALVLSAAYSYKRVNEQQEQQNYCPFAGPCYSQTDRYAYNLNRLLIQIGWMF